MDPLYVQVHNSVTQPEQAMPAGTTLTQINNAITTSQQEHMFGNIEDNIYRTIRNRLYTWKNNIPQDGGYKSRRNRRSKKRRSNKRRSKKY